MEHPQHMFWLRHNAPVMCMPQSLWTEDTGDIGGLKSRDLTYDVSRSALGVFKFSETTGPTEAKFHVAPPWDWGKDGKPIQIIKVISCYSLLLSPGPGTFSRGFATNLAPTGLLAAL